MSDTAPRFKLFLSPNEITFHKHSAWLWSFLFRKLIAVWIYLSLAVSLALFLRFYVTVAWGSVWPLRWYAPPIYGLYLYTQCHVCDFTRIPWRYDQSRPGIAGQNCMAKQTTGNFAVTQKKPLGFSFSLRWNNKGNSTEQRQCSHSKRWCKKKSSYVFFVGLLQGDRVE